MSPETRRIDLPATNILIWLALLAGLVANASLSLAHLLLGGGGLLVALLWAIRLAVLGLCWLLPGEKGRKLWGLGLILGALVLDALLKAPVLGSMEYGDWFLARSLDLSGQYTGYLTVCGFLLSLLMLAGWFILRSRGAAGWAAGMGAALLMGWATWAASGSPSATTTLFVLLGVGRFILPAWVAAAADAIIARRKLSTKS